MKKILSMMGILSLSTTGLNYSTQIFSNDLNIIKNESVKSFSKTNISTLSALPIKVDLTYTSNDKDAIMDSILLELFLSNPDEIEFMNIYYSYLSNPEGWDLLNIDLEKPNPGTSEKYMATLLARPTNNDYIGGFKFEVTLMENTAQKENIILENFDSYHTIGGQRDHDTRTLGERNSMVSIKVLDYAKSIDDFIASYKTIKLTLNFKLVDDSPQGPGTIFSGNTFVTISTKDLKNKTTWTYDESTIKNNPKYIFDNQSSKPTTFKWIWERYTDNRTGGSAELDYKYNSATNSIDFSVISISTKYGGSWNWAYVVSKVTTKLVKIESYL